MSLQILGSHLLQSGRALKETTVHSGSNSQRTTDNGAETSDETQEALESLLTVDNFHGRNILVVRVSTA